ncbi:hypothetical protein FJ366_02935 [Candidatus Dependentiae bacterium]|nr:hypothetical protein [Candidatus Dependentiae bacterium]
MKLTISMIELFIELILQRLEDDQNYFFKKAYYWQIFWDEARNPKYDGKLSIGSTLDDFLILKESFDEAEAFSFGLDVDRMGIILLAIGIGEIQKKDTESNDYPNAREPFIFSKKIIRKIVKYVLNGMRTFSFDEVEIKDVYCWTIPIKTIFDLSVRPVPKTEYLKENVECFKAFIDGHISLDEFDIEVFYWSLKLYCGNWLSS